jgi:hypothetical protein
MSSCGAIPPGWESPQSRGRPSSPTRMCVASRRPCTTPMSWRSPRVAATAAPSPATAPTEPLQCEMGSPANRVRSSTVARPSTPSSAPCSAERSAWAPSTSLPAGPTTSTSPGCAARSRRSASRRSRATSSAPWALLTATGPSASSATVTCMLIPRSMLENIESCQEVSDCQGAAAAVAVALAETSVPSGAPGTTSAKM